MSEAQLSSYEDIPYDSKPLYPTHPDCLATIATLLGMQPAPPARCRVLELGCGTGANLLPMAEALPDSHFLGIDLSPRQIADGRATADALRLTNLDLRALSILDVDDSFGCFDYIICHGVYSWVPLPVQDKILSICARNLAPQGVAYVSYNTYPGWHRRALVREMLNYHVRPFAEPQLRVQQARAFLEFLVRAAPHPDGTYVRLLKEEADVLRPEADSYVFHEHLEDVNLPCYFHEFMDRATAKGLQYLGEAWFHTVTDDLPAEVQETLQQLSGDLVRLEQYLDFLRNRTFRRTLLCQDRVALDRTPSPDVMRCFHVTALVKPLSERPDMTSPAVERFRADDERGVSTNIPVVKAALVCLYEAWPQALAFDALCDAVQARLGQAGDAANALLATKLLQCYLTNLVALHVYPPRLVLRAGERPTASLLARHQAKTGRRITNLRHRIVELGPFEQILLAQLDGSRDRAGLIDTLLELVNGGVLVLRRDGQPLDRPEPATAREILAEALEPSLERLARSALLIA
jgi:methyltransferase-like protein/cyclopropane fatty-acyl-phospholipid synthase-like methyltransferase